MSVLLKPWGAVANSPGSRFWIRKSGHVWLPLAPWQLQSLGTSKRMKALNPMVGGHCGKAFGSLALVFDLQEVGAGDPLVKLVLEHWAMFPECVARNLPEATWSGERGQCLGQGWPKRRRRGNLRQAL